MRYARPRRPQYSCFSILPPWPSTMVLRWVANASTCCALISWRAIRRCSYRAICTPFHLARGTEEGRDPDFRFGSPGTRDHRAYPLIKGAPADRGRVKGGSIEKRGDRGKGGHGFRKTKLIQELKAVKLPLVIRLRLTEA